jgi:hypothetical protein
VIFNLAPADADAPFRSKATKSANAATSAWQMLADFANISFYRDVYKQPGEHSNELDLFAPKYTSHINDADS